MGNSTVCIQSCLPVRRSKQYRFRFLPESSAQVTKTRPCETMGLLLPGPGSVAFHRTLLVGPPMERRFELLSDTIPERPAELRPIPCPHCQGQQQGKRSSLKKYPAIH